MPRPLVTVLGDAVLDVHVSPASTVRPGADIPAAIGLHPGGQGANLAVRLARRGVPVRLACALGDDAAGMLVRRALVDEGVELRAARVPATGSVVVIVGGRGERTMLSQRVPILGGVDLQSAWQGATWLVVSGYLLLERDLSPIAAAGAAPARRAVLGCSLEPGQATAWMTALGSLRPGLLVLNRQEAALLDPGAEDAGSLARGLARRLMAVVVVTDAGGASAAIGEAVVRVAAPRAAAASDTTGAGDAFAGALLAELVAEPWPPSPEAASAAMAVASRLATAVTRTIGAQGRVAGELRAGPSP